MGVRGFLLMALAAAALSDGICDRLLFPCAFVDGGEVVSGGIFPIPGSFNNTSVTGATFWSRSLRGVLEEGEKEAVVVIVAVLALMVVDMIVGRVLVDVPGLIPVWVSVPVLICFVLFPIDVNDSAEGGRFRPSLVIELVEWVEWVE